jgi:hypothetical protein
MNTKCGRCGRPVPPDQMESRYDAIVAGLGGAGRLDEQARNVASAMEAWQCARCERWICNDCILPFVIASRARKMRHQTCGGIFLAPDAPSWVGMKGQRAVAPGSWRARFGIETS